MEKIFQAFAESIMEEERRLLGEGFTVKIMEVPKNNGVVWTGLGISEKMDPVTTIIYLETYFSLYVQGEAIAGLAKEIYEDYKIHAALEGIPHQVTSLKDFDTVKKDIIYRLVNIKMNEKNLSQIPYLPITDLAVTFYTCLGNYKDGKLFSVITGAMMEYWGTSVDELFALAAENTRSLFPKRFGTMEEYLKEMGANGILPEFLPDGFPPSLHILTNQSCQNGAVAILYPDVLKQAAQELGDDLLILPSSIHEVILLPYHTGLILHDINQMIEEINQEQVAISERLSDHAYLYRYHSNELCPVLNGKENTPGFPLDRLYTDK